MTQGQQDPTISNRTDLRIVGPTMAPGPGNACTIHCLGGATAVKAPALDKQTFVHTKYQAMKRKQDRVMCYRASMGNQNKNF